MHSLFFTAPYTLELREAPTPSPAPGEVLVQTICSAISSGTELLIYRGQAPTDLAADDTISALSGSLAFPLRYGYSAVGRVVALGAGVDAHWRDQCVFAFQPHGTHFVAAPADLLPVPTDLDAETATLLPNMETAVNFLWDGHPYLGERVVVLGQGIVGLLTTALLARLPLESLITLDAYAVRRAASLAMGAHAAFEQATQLPASRADLTYELTGAPAVLNDAIAATGFSGRVVIGSWYGQKAATINLGGRFHRSRIQLISSQVSTLTPALLSRWDKARRLQFAWQMLAAIQPAKLITHRLPFHRAAEAYALLDQHPDEAIQVVLTY